MRISDWSSGVCSSDLNYQPTVSRSAATFILSPSGGMATIQKSAFRQLPVYPACHNQIINLDNRADHRNAQTREQLSQYRAAQKDRKSVVSGKSVSVRVDLGGRRIFKKKKQPTHSTYHEH